MYRIEYLEKPPFHPDAVNAHPNSVLIANARGIPAFITTDKKTRQVFLFMYRGKHHLYNKTSRLHDQVRLKESLAKSLAITSAYFGPLADYRMLKVVNRRTYFFLRLILWMVRKKSRRQRLQNLAPLVNIKKHIAVRCTDGCLWDTRAIASTISCMQRLHNVHLSSGRSVIIVLTASLFNIKEFWCAQKKVDDTFPECSLFEGRIQDCRERSFIKGTEAFANVYTNCKITKQSCSVKRWIEPMAVDVVVIGILATYLNSLPFNKKRLWRLFSDTTTEALREIFAELHLSRFCQSRKVGLAISGGGARTAILGANCLQFLKTETKIVPVHVGATSGGAWGVVLHAMQFKDIAMHLYDNREYIHKTQPIYRFLLSAIRRFEGTENMETLTYTLRLLENIDYDWLWLVRTMLFRDHAEPTWDVLFGLPYTVSFTTGILCHSHIN